jgi:hypothetical protein
MQQELLHVAANLRIRDTKLDGYLQNDMIDIFFRVFMTSV